MAKSSAPFTKGQIVLLKNDRVTSRYPILIPNLRKQLHVTACYQAKCQSGWCVSVKYKGEGKLVSLLNSQVTKLIGYDSSWFKPYRGGTVLAGQEP